MTFSFIKNRKVFFAVSIVLVVVSIICFFVRGFNLDIEFVGGTEYNFELKNDAKLDKDALSKELEAQLGDKFSSIRTAGDNSFVVRTTLEGTDYDAINNAILDSIKADYEIDGVTSYNGTVVLSVVAEKEKTTEVVETAETTETAETAETAEAAEAEETEKTVDEKLADKITALSEELGIDAITVVLRPETENEYEIKYQSVSIVSEVVKNHFSEIVVEDETETVVENVSLRGETTISAEVSDSLKSTAILAALVAVIGMLIYIALRFEGRASIAAIVCLVHDILLVMLAYSIFQIPVSSTVIAVILTILGYSINATIVIFDRIRENRKNITSQYTFGDAVDGGIKSTIWRSVNTTITTLLTIGIIYFLGVTSIKNFALPLIVGIISGVYSSVCLSGNVWYALKKIGSKNK